MRIIFFQVSFLFNLYNLFVSFCEKEGSGLGSLFPMSQYTYVKHFEKQYTVLIGIFLYVCFFSGNFLG